MNAFAPYDFEYGVRAGEQWTRFPLGDLHFSVVICYEDTDSEVTRQFVNTETGRPADFLVNISNDAWFDGTSEHEQHLAISRFRAVECRRSLARAVNMGISAVIDGDGRVLDAETLATVEDPYMGTIHIWSGRPEAPGAELPVSRWAEFKKVPGVLVASIPLDRRTSLYVRWGDWLPWMCWLLVGGLVLVPVVRFMFRRKSIA
jgi:apolipoprotein N-acyltransferase